jgi:hypothetical protein
MCGVLLASATATGEYLVYIQVGITGVCEYKGTFAYRVFTAEFAQINRCLLKLYIGTFGLLGIYRKREQCA